MGGGGLDLTSDGPRRFGGGIYPVETTAKPFQIIHPFDPMTYAVNGLRELTVGGIESRLWVAIAVLCGVAGSELVGRQTQSAIHHGTAAPADRSVTIP
ncbi:MAG: putative rane protein [Mycobacterium sp.]|nr:putative rane protein [Mycobacterium sp.]